jgi:hypothetical protein
MISVVHHKTKTEIWMISMIAMVAQSQQSQTNMKKKNSKHQGLLERPYISYVHKHYEHL